MWHEARKQERKIRGMLVDYRKRAERRRDFYEKIKADPTQFLQVHGRQCKIHLDPAIAAAADGPATMMPWQGQNDNMIDRFDVRAHLDYIPIVKNDDDEDITYEERQINYERYRIIAQNSFLTITEEKFLKQLHLEEQFGYTENEPKKKKATGAAIGFNYEDGTGSSQNMQLPVEEEENSDDNSDSDLDVDLSINVSKLDQLQAHEMNRHGRSFGMSSNDFYSFLTHDLEEAESFRLAKEEEHEKALFSGRKSRRERRAHREKRLANRKISPPSYAARESPTLKLNLHDKSESRSPTPENTGKITFITSFGGEEETVMPVKPTYADKVKFGNRLKKLREASEERIVFRESNYKRSNSSEQVSFRKRPRNASRDRRRSRSRSKRMRSRRSSSSSSSTSRSRSRSKRRSRSRSRRSSVRRNKNRRSKSSSRSKSRSNSPNKSRRSSTRSPRSSSRSRSLSIKRSSSKSMTRSRSRSLSKKTYSSSSRSRSCSLQKNESPPKPLPRYYGRKKSDQSSSELGDSTDDDNNKPTTTLMTQSTNIKTGNSGTSTKVNSGPSLSLQERLRRKRQALLNKQFKADKIAEQMKTEREKQEQQNREDELREMALKLRRKQRERRHAYDSDTSNSSTCSEKAKTSTCENKRSRTRSPTPKPRDYREREHRSRENDMKYRNERDDYNKRRYSGERYGRRPSPKSKYEDRREEERDRYYRDDRRRESYRDARDYRDRKERSAGRSLVDY